MITVAHQLFGNTIATSDVPRLSAGLSLDKEQFGEVRTRLVLDGCKWDPQVADIGTLAPFPVRMPRSEWSRLAYWAEALAAETLAAEGAALEDPSLLRELGFPKRLRQVLQTEDLLTPSTARVMRFDFHPTRQGWRISEVNSDVPGGYAEASYFPALMAPFFAGTTPAGNPAEAWVRAVGEKAGKGQTVALLSAPGYMEDQQIMVFLAGLLRRKGCDTWLAQPSQLVWKAGLPRINRGEASVPVDLIVRFYQSEWLARLPNESGWNYLFRAGRVPVTNPGVAVISESKRFPLLWDRLSVALPTWRALLPETRDVREARWRTDDGWIVKAALSNTGDDVGIRELLTSLEWRRFSWATRLYPGKWVAQRRFESVPIPTPIGPRHVCVGVYTIDGRAAGAYVRLGIQSLINFAAMDAALLLDEDHDEPGCHL